MAPEWSFRGAAAGGEPGSHIPEAGVHGFRASPFRRSRNDARGSAGTVLNAHHQRRLAAQREAVRPLTRARPRNTSTASLSCSSLVVPISPEATEGCSPLTGWVVALGSLAGEVPPPGVPPPGVPPPGVAPGAAFGALPLAPGAVASGFFSA